ncbi:hypothetical protein BH10PSE2_BH10PSE2_16420 [soil metagenome]
MQRLKISREGIILIKSFEGFRPRAIRRDDGRWVIGYGHTLSAREGASVSEAEAELLLQYDLIPVAAAVNDGVAGSVNQHQFDALASFASSVGIDRFQTSDVLSRLNAGSADQAADAMVGWPDAAPALEASLRRRAAERALFVADPAWPVALADLLAAPLPPPAIARAPEVQPDIKPEARSGVESDVQGHDAWPAEPTPRSEPALDPVATPAQDAGYAPQVDAPQPDAPELDAPELDAPEGDGPSSRDAAVAALLSEPDERLIQPEPETEAAEIAPLDAEWAAAVPSQPEASQPEPSLPVPAETSTLSAAPLSGANPRYSAYALPIVGPLPAPPSAWSPLPASGLPQIGRFGHEGNQPANPSIWELTPPATPAVAGPLDDPTAPQPSESVFVASQTVASDSGPSESAVSVEGDLTGQETRQPEQQVEASPAWATAATTASVHSSVVSPTFGTGFPADTGFPANTGFPADTDFPADTGSEMPESVTTPEPLVAPAASLWGDVPSAPTTDFSPQPTVETSIVPAWPSFSAQAGHGIDHELLSLTPMPEADAFAASQRLVWPHDEAGSAGPALFDDDDGSLRLTGAPIIRHEVLDDIPLKRVAWREMGAFLIMGGFGLVSFGMSMAAFRRASQSSGSDELTIIAIVLALLGAACVGVAAYNLYRRWGREDGPDPA